MSIGSDKDWLRSIGVSTAAERNLDPVDLDDDEADHELPAAPTPTPPSAAADPEDGAPTIGDSSEPAGARPDQVSQRRPMSQTVRGWQPTVKLHRAIQMIPAMIRNAGRGASTPGSLRSHSGPSPRAR
ncbi:hypothetical protein MAUB_62650 (plasmid) [Mycolicibacterium aubagnense]|uniref:Uncharacterized protein n=1 Tax=Mycolicibacterium aubagnense TaxID=319707 RepID=A0ABN5Z4R5_9MYCO|nr:hypothetical protein MAUB_62650 [Mycolicibacterium aubagnense]